MNLYLDKKHITEEDLIMLSKHIEKKLQSDSETYDSWNQNISNMIDMLSIIKENGLTKEYYAEANINNADVITRFLSCINDGDYLTAYSLSKTPEWYQKCKNNTNRRYLMFYRKLLTIIHNQLEENELAIKKYQKIEPKILEESIVESTLNTLIKQLKQRNYIDAFLTYQECKKEELSDDLNEILSIGLPFLNTVQQKEIDECYRKYQVSFKRGDYNQAITYLNQYKEFIQNNSQNRNIDFHEQRILSMQKEILTSDFVKKEQLFDLAQYYIKSNQYEEAISTLNHYIELDQGVSAKAYLSRGRAYERIQKYQEAKQDYEKSLSIISEPNAWFRLGQINYKLCNFPEALQCYFAYEERRPNKNPKNLEAIEKTYLVLGKQEEADFYKVKRKELEKSLH